MLLNDVVSRACYKPQFAAGQGSFRFVPEAGNLEKVHRRGNPLHDRTYGAYSHVCGFDILIIDMPWHKHLLHWQINPGGIPQADERPDADSVLLPVDGSCSVCDRKYNPRRASSAHCRNRSGHSLFRNNNTAYQVAGPTRTACLH